MLQLQLKTHLLHDTPLISSNSFKIRAITVTVYIFGYSGT